MGGKIAFSGIPNIGEQNQKWLPHPYLLGGPKEGGSATSPLRSRGSPIQGDEKKVAHKRAEVLRHPCVLGGPQTRGQSQRWPAHKWAQVVLLFLEVLKPSKKTFFTRF